VSTITKSSHAFGLVWPAVWECGGLYLTAYDYLDDALDFAVDAAISKPPRNFIAAYEVLDDGAMQEVTDAVEELVQERLGEVAEQQAHDAGTRGMVRV
jgi:hypothetical protein